MGQAAKDAPQIEAELDIGYSLELNNQEKDGIYKRKSWLRP